MTRAILPSGYRSLLDARETEKAIKSLKDFFEENLADALNLERVTAPLFLESGTGLNDDLNGVERPVTFEVRDLGPGVVEIVQSLAKWKRQTLADLAVYPGEGIYADMNAIRPDEVLDCLHSIYVDQWDWERAILEEDRTLEFLERIVRKIYQVLKRSELFIFSRYPEIAPQLPDDIVFVHAQELADLYPDLNPQERENQIAREHGAVFLVGIGADLKDGDPHDDRAPDYDDWITGNGRSRGLNGDIIVWYPLMERGLELSSMGIRVTPDSLLEQLRIRGCLERTQLPFHRRLLSGELPLSIGGGIGQSRLCTFFLRKAHIGEVQAGLWPRFMREKAEERGVVLL